MCGFSLGLKGDKYNFRAKYEQHSFHWFRCGMQYSESAAENVFVI